jgi:hypothetical protein
MIVTLKIDDIRPRDDQRAVIQMIVEYLDNCDPDDRVDLRIGRPTG